MLTCRYFFFSRNMRADLEQFSKGRGPRTYFRTTPYIGNDDRKSFVWSGGGGGGGVRGIFLKVNLSCEFNKFEWHLYSTIQRSIVLYSELILEVSSIPYQYHYDHFQQGRIYYYVPASRVFWKIHPRRETDARPGIS